MRKHYKDEEQSGSADRYLITYADLITLLLGLFVILYSSSQVDAGKYKEFASAMNKYFKEEKPSEKAAAAKPIPMPVITSARKSLDSISHEVTQKLANFLDNGSIEIEQVQFGIKLNLSEKLLFSSGQSGLQVQSLQALDSIAHILQGTNQSITVDGHTDSIPIRSFQYESNWHLSVSRALAVGYYLTQKGLPQRNLAIRGFGAEHPLTSNATQEGRNRNRRVEITISEAVTPTPTTEGYIIKGAPEERLPEPK